MPTNTDGGTTVSLNNTPQAVDDFFAALEDQLYIFDVMSNDLGGKAKVLWSIDNSSDDGSTDLVPKDVAGISEYSELGARIWLTIDGKIAYDTSALDGLAAGQIAVDQFTYAIRMSNGTLSWATVSITIVGTNDAPVVQAVAISADEDGAAVTAGFSGDDIDSDDDGASLVYTITSDPAEGSVANNDDGTFTFDPGADFQDLAEDETRQVTFTYTATDSHGAVSNSGTVTVTVTGTNDDPVVQAVEVAADEDGAAVTAGFSGDDIDSDDDGASLVYTITSDPAEGSVANNDDGTFTFDPGADFQDLAEDETRQVTFNYTATDSHGAVSNSGTVTVTVTGTNDEPVVQAVEVAADEDGAAVTAGFSGDDIDSDDDGASLVYTITSDPAEGSVANNDDGTFTFDPGADFQDLAEDETRQVTFNYTATDSHGAVSNSGTVTVTVTGTNDDPVVQAVEVAADEDGAAVTAGFSGDDIDSDDDGASLVYTITSDPAEGSVANNDDGTFTFDPGADFQDLAEDETRQVTFNYTATDSHGAVSNSGTVTVTVTGTNDEPVVQAVEVAADEDGAAVTAGFSGDDIDSDDDGASLVYTITSDPAEGSVANNDDGTFTFDPGADFQDLAEDETRQVTFNYTATDSHGAVSNSGTVTVTVTGTNDEPVVQAVEVAADEDGAAVTAGFSGDDIDSDDDGASLVYTITSDPAEGSVANNDDGTFTFDPGADFQDLAEDETRQVTFNYTATDSHGAVSNSGTVTVTVTGTNDDPVVQAVEVAADEDGAAVTAGFSGDDIDSDDDGASLVYTITSDPAEGSVVNNDDGTFTFDPGADFQDLAEDETRQVTFTYTATDSHGAVSNSGTVTVTVTGTNDDPVVQAVEVAADEDGAAVTAGFSGDDIDSDDDGASLVYTITSDPAEGSVVNNDDGTFTFDPGADFQDLAEDETRQVTFTYTATDSHGAVSNSGTVTVTVTGTNDEPVVQAVEVAADEDGAAVTAGFSGDDIDSDDDGASLVYTITSDPAEGSVVNNDDGTFTFDPGADFQDLAEDETRQVTFTYTATDSHGAVSNSGTVTVTVTGTNDDPVVQAVEVAADEDGAAVTAGFSGDDIDSDDDGASLVYTITSDPAEGSVVNNDDGTFTFDPGADFQDLAEDETRQVTFTYTATDSHGAVSNSGTVTVTVTGTNDDPDIHLVTTDTAAATLVETNAGLSTSGTLTVNDPDLADVVGSSVTAVVASGTTAGLGLTNAQLLAMLGVAPTSGLPANAADANNLTWSFNSGTEAFNYLGAGQSLTLTYTVTSSDGNGGTDTQDVTITIDGTADNVAPTANIDAWVLSDLTLLPAGTITAAWFLNNDTDADSPSLFVTAVTGLPVGMIANYDLAGHLIDITGTTPAAGSFSLTYTMTDGTTSTTATVSVTVLNTTTGVNTFTLDGNDFSYVDLLQGNDVITGDAVLTGNAGIDIFIGNNNNDTLNGGAGDDKLFGNENTDTLNGGTGNDLLDGGNGTDTLNGGLGNDILAGGAGDDIFIFNSALGGNVDTITDFDADPNNDKIHLENGIFTSLASAGALNAANFASNNGGNAGDVNDYILYDTATGDLYYDADGNGAGAKVLFAHLDLLGVAGTVDAADFVVI